MQKLKTLGMKTRDTPSLERGIEMQGYSPRHELAVTWRGIRGHVRLYKKHGTKAALALLVIGEDHFLFKQINASEFHDGDETEIEGVGRDGWL